MNTFQIGYDEEGDILEVRWGRRTSATTAIELSDNIVLLADQELRVPLGLTLISYRRLTEVPTITLINLPTMPVKVQQKIRALLRQEPVSKFMRLDGETVKVRGGTIALTRQGPLLTPAATHQKQATLVA